uniref:Small ribosomal subunit protein uS13m n=1 Tax=Silene noctiflora TaxID=39899 RepID=D7RMZ8_9CARY|nr:ribosomal protein S13 [Silene noctiflora]AEM46218.1 ribosomal protein S13 [Silene noctiflora]AJP34463.1 ribosomal protein S13 [Silene noctiflora]
MPYISGARLVDDKQVKIALTKISGIGRKKGLQLSARLGLSENIKIKELTKYQIDKIEEIIEQEHIVHWELKRSERTDIDRLISISCYRGIRHQDGLPLRGQRSHTNARTSRKRIQK